jgi:hypothetical protein
MSSATATRPRRAKKPGGKASKRKRAAAGPAATPVAAAKSTEVRPADGKPSERAGKKPKPPPPPVDAARPKPKMRASPPPVDLEIDPDVLQFIKAIDDYRATHDRPFPSWSEVLYVLKRLGYRKG